MITINIDKAKEIKKQSLRVERAPLLSQLDVQFQRALESGDDTSEIITKKQTLRDATAPVEAAETVEQLKAISLPDVGV
jgi:hypothetical protein